MFFLLFISSYLSCQTLSDSLQETVQIDIISCRSGDRYQLSGNEFYYYNRYFTDEELKDRDTLFHLSISEQQIINQSIKSLSATTGNELYYNNCRTDISAYKIYFKNAAGEYFKKIMVGDVHVPELAKISEILQSYVDGIDDQIGLPIYMVIPYDSCESTLTEESKDYFLNEYCEYSLLNREDIVKVDNCKGGIFTISSNSFSFFTKDNHETAFKFGESDAKRIKILLEEILNSSRTIYFSSCLENSPFKYKMTFMNSGNSISKEIYLGNYYSENFERIVDILNKYMTNVRSIKQIDILEYYDKSDTDIDAMFSTIRQCEDSLNESDNSILYNWCNI